MNAEYQSVLGIYKEFKSYGLISSLNLLILLSPNNLIIGLSMFRDMYLDIIDWKHGKW